MSVVELALSASTDYPTNAGGPYSNEIALAKSLFEAELASEEGWEDQGIREDVQLMYKRDPLDAYAVPTVKGECIVEGVTPAEFLAVISLPGMRKRWDSRFEGAHILSRYSRSSYAFYSVMKGMGWLVYPRDICGVQANYQTSPEELIVIQTSIEADALAPVQSGKTRATLGVSGWQLLQQGSDLKVTYIVKVSLNGSIPSALVNMIATETPLCTGRARDVFNTIGFAPYHGEASDAIILQNETFSDPGATAEDVGDLEYGCTFTSTKGVQFTIIYSKKMYPNGVSASSDSAKVIVTDNDGTVSVDCGESDGEVVKLTISPKVE